MRSSKELLIDRFVGAMRESNWDTEPGAEPGVEPGVEPGAELSGPSPRGALEGFGGAVKLVELRLIEIEDPACVPHSSLVGSQATSKRLLPAEILVVWFKDFSEVIASSSIFVPFRLLRSLTK
jgi:hypothetical protein